MKYCDYCNNEYNKNVPGVIKNESSCCMAAAVIPSITVENPDGLQNVAACFVHVTSVNTTYYVDDKSRITKIWAGPVEYNNYDYETNPLNLRSQEIWDFENNRVIYYNKVGSYRLGSLTEV